MGAVLTGRGPPSGATLSHRLSIGHLVCLVQAGNIYSTPACSVFYSGYIFKNGLLNLNLKKRRWPAQLFFPHQHINTCFFFFLSLHDSYERGAVDLETIPVAHTTRLVCLLMLLEEQKTHTHRGESRTANSNNSTRNGLAILRGSVRYVGAPRPCGPGSPEASCPTWATATVLLLFLFLSL